MPHAACGMTTRCTMHVALNVRWKVRWNLRWNMMPRGAERCAYCMSREWLGAPWRVVCCIDGRANAAHSKTGICRSRFKERECDFWAHEYAMESTCARAHAPSCVHLHSYARSMKTFDESIRWNVRWSIPSDGTLMRVLTLVHARARSFTLHPCAQSAHSTHTTYRCAAHAAHTIHVRKRASTHMYACMHA